MENIIFRPWIGCDYNSGGIFNRKILALGESHYFLEEETPIVEVNKPSNFTTDIVDYYLYHNKSEFSGWMNTYRKFERALVNKKTNTKDSINIWNSIAFYNYLQIALTEPRQKVPKDFYRKSEKPFFEVLEKLRPDLVVVWGRTRMWCNMPENNYEACKSLYNGYYILNDGTKIKTIWINHPSSGFNWSYWHEIIEEEL